MIVYPHQTAIILENSIFLQYGGQSGTHTQAQLDAAYRIAEQQATSYLGTFLLPTIVTGTFGYAPRIVTDYGYVSQILGVNILSKDNWTNCTLRSDNGCVFVWQDTYGYLDVSCLVSYCNCAGLVIPYQVQVVYQAGLPTGVANQPAVLLALTMAAQISLNEMSFPSANETTGDVGVQEFSSMGYSEKRVALKANSFGNSAKANKVGQLLGSVIKRARPTLILR